MYVRFEKDTIILPNCYSYLKSIKSGDVGEWLLCPFGLFPDSLSGEYLDLFNGRGGYLLYKLKYLILLNSIFIYYIG